MKILLLYIKKICLFAILILFTLFSSHAKSETLSVFSETPIIVNPESEYEGFLIDIILDKMIYHYYKIPEDGVKKHNSTLFLSISDPSHGKIYSWKSGSFYGLIRMISSKKKKENICSFCISFHRPVLALANEKVWQAVAHSNRMRARAAPGSLLRTLVIVLVLWRRRKL